jgi:hypothetical protein
MPPNSIKICATVLVLAAVTVGQVQAAGKGTPNLGVSTIAPGHQAPIAGDSGKSGNAPGDLKHDPGTAAKDAKGLAPGSKNPNKN